MVNEKIPEPRWEALKGFTSEKYKEKRRKRDTEIELAVGKLWEMYENSEKYKKQRKMVKKLLIAQLIPVGAFITTITLLIIFLG